MRDCAVISGVIIFYYYKIQKKDFLNGYYSKYTDYTREYIISNIINR